MKTRFILLLVMVLAAGFVGLYVSSCEVSYRESPGGERQTKGSLSEEETYTSPESQYQTDAERGGVPADIQPMDVHTHEPEHSPEVYTPAPESHPHVEGHPHVD